MMSAYEEFEMKKRMQLEQRKRNQTLVDANTEQDDETDKTKSMSINAVPI